MKSGTFLAASVLFMLMACKNSQHAAGNLQHLLEQSWELVELRGQPFVVKEGKKAVLLNFVKEDTRVNGFAGCNNFMGGYEVKEGNRIEFKQIASTLMACEEMETESVLLEVLRTTDNYTVADDVLSLNKARMAPLAKFKLQKTK